MKTNQLLRDNLFANVNHINIKEDLKLTNRSLNTSLAKTNEDLKDVKRKLDVFIAKFWFPIEEKVEISELQDKIDSLKS